MKTGIRVRDAMTKNPVTASPENNIQECAQKMLKQGVGSLVIKDNGKLVGIISEKDFVNKIVSQGLDPIKTKAKDIMSKNLFTIEPDKDIYDALILMGKEETRKLPVVEKNKLLGFLTVRDILKLEPALFEIRVGQFKIKEEEEKLRREYREGICSRCQTQGPVIKKGNKFLCESCK